MTFIYRNKQKSKISVIIIALFALLGAEVSTAMFFYSQSVNVKHETAQFTDELREAEAENADLKAGLTALFGAENVKVRADEFGMVAEKNPEYVKMTNKVALSMSGE